MNYRLGGETVKPDRDVRGDAGSNGDRQGAIRERAYERWASEGRPAGREMIHWLEAEREIAEEQEGEPPSVAGSTPETAHGEGDMDLRGAVVEASSSVNGHRTQAESGRSKKSDGSHNRSKSKVT